MKYRVAIREGYDKARFEFKHWAAAAAFAKSALETWKPDEDMPNAKAEVVISLVDDGKPSDDDF